MKNTVKKIWNIVSTVFVVLIVTCAVLLMGLRLIGYQVFNVISGSMEPEYSVGDLIYVKEVDVNSIGVGDDITFILNEDLVVATHRVVRVDAENQHFYTKGLANEAEDSAPVHFNNVIGVPSFSIPKLGYVSDFIQTPPGMYITIAAVAVLIILVFLPDMFGKKTAEKEKKATIPTASLTTTYIPKSCKDCKHFMKDVDLPNPVCTFHKFQFEGEYNPCNDYAEQ